MKFLYIFMYIINFSSCFIKVIDNESNFTVAKFDDEEAEFGGHFIQKSIAYIIESQPHLACNSSIEPPPIFLPNGSGVFFVSLIKRGTCSYEHKVKVAQESGYEGVIIYNDKSDDIYRMKKSGNSKNEPIFIPSRMVGLRSGNQLRQYTFTLSRQQFTVMFFNERFDPPYYIISFLGFVSLGFLLIGIGFGVKFCRNCILKRANYLKKSHLKSIPIKKFVRGEDNFDMCAICLDDFIDGDKLRILPCNHAYHMKCIDPWLLKQKRNCPVCKSRIKIPGRVDDSDDNSSIANHSEINSVHVDEDTPLISPRGNRSTQPYFSQYDNDGNFAPDHPESNTRDGYDNPCIDDSSNMKESDPSIHHLASSNSINNDGSDIFISLTVADCLITIVTPKNCPEHNLSKVV